MWLLETGQSSSHLSPQCLAQCYPLQLCDKSMNEWVSELTRVPCVATIGKVRALSPRKAIPLAVAPPLCFCSNTRSFFMILNAQTFMVQTINKLGEFHVWSCWAGAVPGPRSSLLPPVSSLGSSYTLRNRMGEKGSLVSQTVWNTGHFPVRVVSCQRCLSPSVGSCPPSGFPSHVQLLSWGGQGSVGSWFLISAFSYYRVYSNRR